MEVVVVVFSAHKFINGFSFFNIIINDKKSPKYPFFLMISILELHKFFKQQKEKGETNSF